MSILNRCFPFFQSPPHFDEPSYPLNPIEGVPLLDQGGGGLPTYEQSNSGFIRENLLDKLKDMTNKAYDACLTEEKARVYAKDLYEAVTQLKPVQELTRSERFRERCFLSSTVITKFYHPYFQNKNKQGQIEQVALPIFVKHLLKETKRAKAENRLNAYQIVYGTKIANLCMKLMKEGAGKNANLEIAHYVFSLRGDIEPDLWKKLFVSQPRPDNGWIGDQHLDALVAAVAAGSSKVEDTFSVDAKKAKKDADFLNFYKNPRADVFKGLIKKANF